MYILAGVERRFLAERESCKTETCSVCGLNTAGSGPPFGFHYGFMLHYSSPVRVEQVKAVIVASVKREENKRRTVTRVVLSGN